MVAVTVAVNGSMAELVGNYASYVEAVEAIFTIEDGNAWTYFDGSTLVMEFPTVNYCTTYRIFEA